VKHFAVSTILAAVVASGEADARRSLELTFQLEREEA